MPGGNRPIAQAADAVECPVNAGPIVITEIADLCVVRHVCQRRVLNWTISDWQLQARRFKHAHSATEGITFDTAVSMSSSDTLSPDRAT
jgi:hypothetical protein